MIYRTLADLAVLVHFLFIVFVLFGGIAVLRWRWIAWLHIPCAIWGALIEFAGWICPLTPLENQLRTRSGSSGYESGFIEHYLLPIIYPEALTRNVQIILGIVVLLINMIIYGLILFRKKRNAEK